MDGDALSGEAHVDLKLVTSMNIGINSALVMVYIACFICTRWWRLQMETFSALLALCAGNSPVTG